GPDMAQELLLLPHGPALPKALVVGPEAVNHTAPVPAPLFLVSDQSTEPGRQISQRRSKRNFGLIDAERGYILMSLRQQPITGHNRHWPTMAGFRQGHP